MSYYLKGDVLEVSALQCKNREVFLRKSDTLFSSRPLKAESEEELEALIKKYNFKEPYGILASLEYYSNPLDYNSRTGWDFAIDLDGDSIDQLKNCVQSLVGVLKTFNIETFKIKFSGRRGFHLIIGGEAFNVFKNQVEFIRAYPELPKIICKFLEASLKPEQKKEVDFDYNIYQPRRLLRLAYSLHEESSLVSLPLSIDEIPSFKLEDAKSENIKINWDWLSIKPRFGEALDLLDAVSKWVKRRKDEAPVIKIARARSLDKSLKRYEWIENFLKRPVDDGRHRILWLIVAPYLVNVKGLSIEDAEKQALEYLERCNEMRRVEGNLKGLARYYIKYAKERGFKPISLPNLERDYPDLYQLIKSVYF